MQQFRQTKQVTIFSPDGVAMVNLFPKTVDSNFKKSAQDFDIKECEAPVSNNTATNLSLIKHIP
jgi:hypothetical protein